MIKKETKWIIAVVAVATMIFNITVCGTFFNLLKQKINNSHSEVASEATTEMSYVDVATDISDIYGGWESEAYYEFREDGTYGWYKNSENLNDNYYSGTYTVIKGYEACEHLGISLEKILTVVINSKGDVSPTDIYCITCSPTYLISGGVDKTDTLSGISYDLLFIVVGEKNAQGMLVSNGDTYYFTKIK